MNTGRRFNPPHDPPAITNDLWHAMVVDTSVSTSATPLMTQSITLVQIINSMSVQLGLGTGSFHARLKKVSVWCITVPTAGQPPPDVILTPFTVPSTMGQSVDSTIHDIPSRDHWPVAGWIYPPEWNVKTFDVADSGFFACNYACSVPSQVFYFQFHVDWRILSQTP